MEGGGVVGGKISAIYPIYHFRALFHHRPLQRNSAEEFSMTTAVCFLIIHHFAFLTIDIRHLDIKKIYCHLGFISKCVILSLYHFIYSYSLGNTFEQLNPPHTVCFSGSFFFHLVVKFFPLNISLFVSTVVAAGYLLGSPACVILYFQLW